MKTVLLLCYLCDLGVHPAPPPAEEAPLGDARLALGDHLHAVPRRPRLFRARHRPPEAPQAPAAEPLLGPVQPARQPGRRDGDPGPPTRRPRRSSRPCPARDRQFLQLLSRINHLPVSSVREASASCATRRSSIPPSRSGSGARGTMSTSSSTSGAEMRPAGGSCSSSPRPLRRGVIVRLLLDGVGSHAFTESLLAEFSAAGGQFSWFQSLDPKRNRFFLNLRNHRKLQIMDGTIRVRRGHEHRQGVRGPRPGARPLARRAGGGGRARRQRAAGRVRRRLVLRDGREDRRRAVFPGVRPAIQHAHRQRCAGRPRPPERAHRASRSSAC